MLPNNIQDLNEIFHNFNFNKSVNHDIYDGHFFDHLTSLLKYRLLNNDLRRSEFNLNYRNYLGLEQYIMDNTNIVENDSPKNIDWNFVDDAKDIFLSKIKSLLKNESSSETLKPFLKSTVNSFENWIIYSQLHPDSNNNPWFHTYEIIMSGFLFLTSDNRDYIKEFNKSLLEKENQETSNNIFILAKSQNERKFSGVLVDNRLNTQSLVFDYLRTYAVGRSSAKSSKIIKDFLVNKNKVLDDQQIRDSVILPLKRAGLIGSSTQGYFYISNFSDLEFSFQHHKEKMRGIVKTMKIYQNRAKKEGWDNLDF